MSTTIGIYINKAHIIKHMTQMKMDYATCCAILPKTLITKIFVTDFDRNLYIDNITYTSDQIFSYSNIESFNSLNADNFQIKLSINHFNNKNFLHGLYNDAFITIFRTNYNDINKEKILLKSGRIKKIKITDNQITAEIKSISEKNKQLVNNKFSPSCRAQFCDELCKLKEVDFLYAGQVTEIVTENKKFVDISLSKPKNYFKYGILTFTNGENANLKQDVKYNHKHEIELTLTTPNKIKPGDQYNIIAGCDKLASTCTNKFNNIINFRGEPHLPGSQNLFKHVES